jgi:hypothetical protein
MTVRINGQEIQVTGIRVEDFEVPTPFVLCSQDGQIEGIDPKSAEYLKASKRVRIMFDESDGRVVLADAHLFRGVLYCMPTQFAFVPTPVNGSLWQS